MFVRGARDSQTFRTKREAESWSARRETELRAQQEQHPGDRTPLADVLERYKAEVSPTKRGRRWEEIRIDKFLRDPLLPMSRPVAALTPDDVGIWRDARLKEVQPSSVLRELALLGVILEHARREWRLIAVNPVRDVRRPRAPDHREVVISRAQIRAMLEEMGHIPGQRITTVRHALAVCFLLALRTGMRAGELCKLTWDNVEADYCVLPETKTVPRKVPLEPKARRLVEQMRGWDDRLVFGLKAASLDALFRRYRERAGLEGFTFHDSRHTAATWLSRRLDVLDLCKMFGWANPKFALVYYNPTASDIAKRIERSRAR